MSGRLSNPTSCFRLQNAAEQSVPFTLLLALFTGQCYISVVSPQLQSYSGETGGRSEDLFSVLLRKVGVLFTVIGSLCGEHIYSQRQFFVILVSI